MPRLSRSSTRNSFSLMAVMAERPMFRPWRGSVGVALPFLLYARYPEADRAAALKKFVA